MATCITHQTDVLHPVAGPRTRLRDGAVLPESDYSHLLEHLEICERDRGPCWPMSCTTRSLAQSRAVGR